MAAGLMKAGRLSIRYVDGGLSRNGREAGSNAGPPIDGPDMPRKPDRYVRPITSEARTGGANRPRRSHRSKPAWAELR